MVTDKVPKGSPSEPISKNDVGRGATGGPFGPICINGDGRGANNALIVRLFNFNQ